MENRYTFSFDERVDQTRQKQFAATWASSNSKIVSCSANGDITAVAAGEANLPLKGDGITPDSVVVHFTVSVAGADAIMTLPSALAEIEEEAFMGTAAAGV